METRKLCSIAGGAAIALSLIAVSPIAYGDATNVEIVPSTTYYVSASGSDDNDGQSEATPFKTLDKVNTLTLHAGDRVLLKRGDTFNNQHLCITGDAAFRFNDGSGCAFQADVDGAPLVISAYGDGDAKPVIAANGVGRWKLDYGLTLSGDQHYLAKDAVSSTVLLKDAENIEITDLEITNKRVEDASGKEEGCLYNDNCALDRTGIAGVAQNKGTLDHVVLKDLYVHDVEGNVYNKHSLNGAIYFSAFIATEKMRPEAERRNPSFRPALEEPSTGFPRFNDLQIVDNRVENSGRWGIAGVYSAYGSIALDPKDQIPDADITKYGATNVVMSRNFIKNIGGDAITVMYGYKPVIESNVATEIAAQINTTDYLFEKDGHAGKFDKIGGRVAASIWPWKSKDAVFRFNEGFNTLGADKGNGDGMPWDADSGDGTLYEYNYSANNSGGTVMFCGHQAANSTFRFNIAQNDAMGALSPTYWDPNYNRIYPNAHVYNNTFFLKEGASILHPAQAQQGTMLVENNIFYNVSEQPRQEDWVPTGTITWKPDDIDGNAKVAYSNNLYYNYANYPDSDMHAVKVAKGESVMVNPGSGPLTPLANMAARNHYFPGLSFAEADANVTDFDGYKLAEGSPAIGRGKAITDWNGFEIGTDFFGRSANTVDIGAVSTDNRDPVEPEGPEEEPLAEQAKLLDTIYQVTDGQNVPSKNAEYAAGNHIHVPSTINNPSTVAEIISKIDADGKAEIVNQAGEVQDSTAVLAEGMKLRLTGGNAKSIEFPLVIDNEYDWVNDYTHAVQGNVWFGQKQNGANGKWVNIDKADNQWPNWVVDQYYGPGINGADKAPADRSNLHGLLSDSPDSAGATAMAWRAPKAGYITFKVKGASNGKPAEPYLRQGDATGGTVTVKLVVADEEQRSLTLATKEVRPDGEFDVLTTGADALFVKQGDYVRVVAESTGKPSQPSMFVSPTITYLDQKVDAQVEPAAPDVNTEVDRLIGEYQPAPRENYVEGMVPGFKLQLADGVITGKVTLPEVEGINYLVNGAPLEASYPAGEVVVTIVAKDGYKLGESSTTEWKFAVPATPEFDSVTGELTIPTVTGVVYDMESQTVHAGETLAVTATAADGYSFADARTVKWTFVADSAQPVDPKDPVKPADLKDPVKPVEPKDPVKPVGSKDPAKIIAWGLPNTGASVLAVAALAGILGAAGTALVRRSRQR